MRYPLRIAMISEHASPLATIGGVDAGGQNIYVAHLAARLVAQGHRVDVLTRRDDPNLPAIVEMRSGARVVHIDAGPTRRIPKEELLAHMPEFARETAAFMRREGPHDLVHANFFMSGWVALHLQRTLGVPFVITFHALGLVRLAHQREADAFPPQRLQIERDLVQHASVVIAECAQDHSDLVTLYGADPKRLVVIPCGFDPGEFAPMDTARARIALGLPLTDFIVLQLGRLVPRKGIDNVIRAMAQLPAQVPARLLVVGGEADGADQDRSPELARLRQLAQACGVAERVLFTGYRQRSDLRTYYAAANAFVTTPWYEPFGITPLEAMACATPVVGSAVGGIKHTVVDGVTGLLVPPRDPTLLAEKLARLHAEPTMARAMGAAGLRRAHAHFTWDRVAADVAAVYARVRRTHAARSGARPDTVLALPV